MEHLGFALFWDGCEIKKGSKAAAMSRYKTKRPGGSSNSLSSKWNRYAEDCQAAGHALCHISTWISQERYDQKASDFFTGLERPPQATAPSITDQWQQPTTANAGFSDEQAEEIRQTREKRNLARAAARDRG